MLKHSSVSKCPLNCWKSFQYSTLNSSVNVGQLTQHCILHTLFLLIEVELNKIKFHIYLKRAILFWINRDTIKVADPNPGISVGSGSESWNQVRSGPGLKKWSDPDLVLKFGRIRIQSVCTVFIDQSDNTVIKYQLYWLLCPTIFWKPDPDPQPWFHVWNKVVYTWPIQCLLPILMFYVCTVCPGSSDPT